MNPLIGTCSWNYDSWVDLVYTGRRATAAEYLTEYSEKYQTVEIDSWFYRLPDPAEVIDYLSYAGNELRFTCKLSSRISLTHKRQTKARPELIENPDFLSDELFQDYLSAIEPMLPRIDALILEFEYLNKQKMPSQEHFMHALDDFIRNVPADIPLAVESRNSNFLNKEYFQFLKQKGVIHVFSEKIYMPGITSVYENSGSELAGSTVIRLLGGDRKAVEKKTNNKWNSLVEPKNELVSIVQMTRDLVSRGKRVTVNVNNHYEGSAPLTIRKILDLINPDTAVENGRPNIDNDAGRG